MLRLLRCLHMSGDQSPLACRALLRLIVLSLIVTGTSRVTRAADAAPEAQELTDWEGTPRSIAGLKGEQRAAIGFPVKQRAPLSWTGDEDLPPGLYRLRFTLRASHVTEEIAWHGALVVKAGDKTIARFPAIDFVRTHEPEVRAVDFVHAEVGPLKLELSADMAAEVFERVVVLRNLDPKGPKPDKDESKKEPAEDDLLAELTVSLKPATHFYFVLDEAELSPLSRSGVVSSVTVNKVRYTPGEELHGAVTLQSAGESESKGTLVLSLERGLNARTKVREIPVTLGREPQTVKFDVSLPKEQLGYALVAEFVGAKGSDRSSAAEYFTVTDNFERVSIWGGLGAGHGGTFRPAAEMQKACRDLRSTYVNAVEQFAWAEEDMVEMSPEADVWYSGQTCYRLSKAGLQRLIASAHDEGIAMTTYGKFVMSGYLGWNTAWTYPQDHKGQFVFPVGMWEGCNVQLIDRFRFKEFIPYEHGVPTGGLLKPFWQAFVPINPDATPRMTLIAAEETIRSIEMFGWDGIRWDGHMRGGGSAGGAPGEFSFPGARKTQSLVRYFKDIVAEKFPAFGHGYNYLFVQEKPDYDWAYDDFELDELCRGGGLLMNESIGNTTAGKPFGWLAKNIQVEGDLARERGGFLLGISYADNPRDQLVESIMYFAGGCRPMGGAAKLPLINRYGTRFAKYTFDETLRRLAKPESVLKPAEKTTLWWQPFVYETQRVGGKSQLVVNLVHIPQEAVTRGGETNRPIDWTMPTGTAPVDFQLTLPAGYKATAAHTIDPFTLAVTAAPLKGKTLSAPAVDAWQVLIVDLESDGSSATLAERFGPPKTFGTPRPGLQEKRFDPVVLDVAQPLAEVEQVVTKAFGTGNNPFAEAEELRKLTWEKRNEALLKRKALPANSADAFVKGWWKGGSLPADLKLQEKRPEFGELAPRRDGIADVFVARGAMSHRLRVDPALAHFGSCRTAEATLAGFSFNYSLRGNITPAQLPQFDLLVYADIPHGAIGPEMCYALVDYVKAGGGVVFTGGQYSFGKGGYAWTVLDRELLPVEIVETVDTRISSEPLPLEPGDDFAALGVKVNWKEHPSFFVFNEVTIRPKAGVKVFLKSGNRPILVGRELGEGRVVCLLATPMGQSTDSAKLFTEWSNWPALLAAALRWAAPAAAEASSAEPPDESAVAAVVQEFGRSKADGDLDDLLEGKAPAPSEPDSDADSVTSKNAVKGLDPKTLARRLGQIETLLAGTTDETRQILATQLATIPNLPDDVRWRVLGALSRAAHISSPPHSQGGAKGGKPRASTAAATPSYTSVAKTAFESPDLRLHTNGLALLAVAGSDVFTNYARTGVPASDGEKLAKDRALALALPFYRQPDLVDAGKAQLAKWSQVEATRLKAYSGGNDFTLAAPPAPLLDSESLLLRLGWLAYLAGQSPKEFAAPFAREWAMLGQYAEYCEITEAGLWSETQNASPAKRGKIRADVSQVHEYRTALGRVQAVSRPRLESLLETHPAEVAQGFAAVRFQHAAEAAVKLLMSSGAEKTARTNGALRKAPAHPILKEFAAASE